MRLGIVEGRWALEGWAVRGLSRLILMIVLALIAVVVLGVVWWTYTWVMANLEAEAVERRWAEVGRPFEMIVERHPAVVADSSAVRLEELARPLGIDLVPKAVEDRARPNDASTGHLEAISEHLNAYAQTFGRSDRRVTEPPDVESVTYLERHEGTLARVVDHLLREELPGWECDVTAALDAPLPNLLGHIRLTRILLVWSAQLERTSRLDQAQQAIEAAWQLHLAAARRPEYLSQLVAIAEANMIAGAVRNQPDPPASWADLLLSFDPRPSVLDSVQFDAWVSLEGMRQGDVFGADNVFARLFVPAARRGMAKNSEALRLAVLTLPQSRFAGFDPGEGFSVALETVMPVSITGRIALVDVWQGWAQVGRSMLCRELSAEVVRLRHAGIPPSDGGEPPAPREQVSTVFPSVSWRFVSDGEGLLIEPSQPLPAVPPGVGRSLCSTWYEEVSRGR